MKYMGIDIGGTKIRCAIISDDGKVLSSKSIPTLADRNGEEIVNSLLELIDEFLVKYEIEGIGIGAPGPLNPLTGLIIEPQNLKTLWGINLVNIVTEHTDKKTFLENDANVAALGEAVFGSGKDGKAVQYVTLSTGVGGGLVMDGKLVQGHAFMASEIGSMVINREEDGFTILENLCSGTALAKKAKDSSLTDEGGKRVFELENEGNSLASKLIRELLDDLAVGIVNIFYAVAPDVFVLGGGVSDSLTESHIEYLKSRCDLYLYESARGMIDIRKAGLKSDSGVIGAALLSING